MVVGFNHNFRYKGELFHVQTEDGGLKNPHIATLLYRGGTILASKKTSYADITKADRLEQVVEELMKEQHQNMLRRLKNGEFDEIIADRGLAASAAMSRPPESVSALPGGLSPQAVPPVQKTEVLAKGKPEMQLRPEPGPGRMEKGAHGDGDLDEIILSYLLGEGEDPKIK